MSIVHTPIAVRKGDFAHQPEEDKDDLGRKAEFFF
jgi:hypothetical protein